MGCVINRGKRHQPRWYVKYRDIDGAWKMVPSHQPTKDQARQYVEHIEARIANGKIGIPEPTPEDLSRQRLTVKELADTFLRDYSSPRLKDAARYRKAVSFTLHHLTGSLGYMRVADVGRLHLARLRDEKLAAGLSKATVKLVLAYSSRMWNWARTEGLIDGPNPVTLVDKPSVAGQAMDFNFLSLDEADRLLSWARENQPTEYPVYATALYTGLRMGEMWGLRWADCDLDRGLLTVRRSYRLAPKSGKPRAVPMNPVLLPILRQWRNDCPASDEALVFPTARGYMRQKDRDYGFKAALTGAECHPVGFHGLRHTFASHFMMSGGNILALQKLLGHSSVAVTMKYAHLAPDFMRDEIGRLRFERPTAEVTDLAAQQRLAG
ncbi:MAG: tyrosine-type recombinase/integrase [Polyangia bacterium]